MTPRTPVQHWKSATVHENDMGEFREIPNTSGDYKISADGVVVSRRRRGLPAGYWIILSQTKSKNSRPFNRVAIFFDDGTNRTCQVSRLLLEAWVGPAPQLEAHRCSS